MNLTNFKLSDYIREGDALYIFECFIHPFTNMGDFIGYAATNLYFNDEGIRTVQIRNSPNDLEYILNEHTKYNKCLEK